ncbi:MAG: hypothetical protein EPO08_21175 [Rhodospirillaceae bacterium]|nr:MAG: hypothetical protein EPO08_21175 [Rhodospirillaceae bacterium]
MTNKYIKNIKLDDGSFIEIDVYDVLQAWNVTNPAIQHGIKKLLQPGERGTKSKRQDIEEARQSIVRALELEDDDKS